MRRVAILAITLCSIGCSSHSGAVPLFKEISPQIYQKQPFPTDDWTKTKIPALESGKLVIISDLALDKKSNFWVVSNDYPGGISFVSKVTMNQKVTSYPLDIAGFPYSIAVGQDQNLWVSAGGGVIARVTPSGTETDYNVTTSDMYLRGITNGPDGALWFLECNNSQQGGIGRITTSGVYTFFPEGCQSVITGGPDGNIWYSNATNIYSMTTTGVPVGQFYLGDAFVESITTGPDGALWLAGEAGPMCGNEIHRVTVSGTDSVFCPKTNALYGITSGPDGNLWFSGRRSATYQLGTFNPNTLTFGPVIKGYKAVGPIAFGPDGNLWEAGANNVIPTYVRLVITISPTPVIIPMPGQTANLDVSETNYSGAWSGSSSNKAVATVKSSGTPGVLTVTAVGVGKCVLTIKDSMFNTVQVNATVQ